MKDNKKTIIGVVIAVLVIAGLIWYFSTNKGEVIPPPPDPDISITGQVLYLPFDGNLNAKNGNNGVLTGTAILTTDSKIGSGAVKFNGQEGYVDAGVLSTYNTRNAVTLSAWVKYDTLKHSYIIDKEKSYLVQLYVGTVPQFQGAIWFDDSVSKIAGGSAQQYIHIVDTGSMAVEAGKWYHVVYVYDSNAAGTNAVIYINGQVAGTGSFNKPMISVETEKVKIGGKGMQGWDRNINGVVDDARVFNRALSAQEVTQLYNAGTGGKIPLSIVSAESQ